MPLFPSPLLATTTINCIQEWNLMLNSHRLINWILQFATATTNFSNNNNRSGRTPETNQAPSLQMARDWLKVKFWHHKTRTIWNEESRYVIDTFVYTILYLLYLQQTSRHIYSYQLTPTLHESKDDDSVQIMSSFIVDGLITFIFSGKR